MIPKSLSASAAETYENCPRSYQAQYIDERVQEVSRGHAELGTACHEAMEFGVANHVMAGEELPLKQLLAYYDDAYWKLFADRARYDEGVGMLKRWHGRQDWSDREVISTEQKTCFMLPTSIGEVKVNYIYDRLDRTDAGEIEVIDYKTFSQPVSAAQMRDKIQPRLYALAAAIAFKEENPKRIWVVYDLLRFEPVSVSFSRDDNVDTWKYIRKLAERIIADDEPEERINSGCRWCIRNHECETLAAHMDAGGVLKITDPIEAGERRDRISNAISAMDSMKEDLDTFLLDYLKREDQMSFTTPSGIEVKATARGNRVIDAERLMAIVGAERVAALGKPSVTAVDDLVKNGNLTDAQKSAVKQLFRKEFGKPSIATKRKAEIEG